MNAIETAYKGYRFRSRLEARWAVFFDAMGIEWKYETEGFQLSRCRYLPDFWLPKVEMFIEVKPGEEYAPQKWIYIAGKVSGTWREKFSTRGHGMSGPNIYLKHSPGIHYSNGEHTTTRDVVDSCLNGIDEADYLFAWIDTLDTFATLAEIGYAAAIKKPCFIGVDESLKKSLFASATPFCAETTSVSRKGDCGPYRHDLWFIEEMATQFDWYSEAQEAFDRMLGSITFDQEKCLELSILKKRAAIVYGDPLECLMYDKCDTFRNGGITSRSGYLGHVLDLNVGNIAKIRECGISARSARFEHGENGAK